MAGWYGWAGAVLNIDLSNHLVVREPLSPEFARKHLGASGFNSIKLFEKVKPEVDSLSPENVLMFAAGPLAGTLAPGSSRLTVTAKSPLTDAWGDATMGGNFASELKYAGYDQICVTGKSESPVYLWIDDDRVEIRDAAHLWGQLIRETSRTIREELGDPDIEVICIGPAGENLVRFASIINPLKKAAGRTGLGAVMGSKNLKAIAVRGSTDVTVANPEEFLRICTEMRDHNININPIYDTFHDYGSPGLVDIVGPRGSIGIRNFQKHDGADWQAISSRKLKAEFVTSMRACITCQVACGNHYTVPSGEFAGILGEGPEFGDLCNAFGHDFYDLPAILKMTEQFNQYGIDSMSAGVLIAWAMECHQRGILSDADFDGAPPAWGDYHWVIGMIPKIARRQGFGNILAEGEKRAPQMVGRDSAKYLFHVKGTSVFFDDARANKALGLEFLTSTTGHGHKSFFPVALSTLRGTEIGEDIFRDPETMDRTKAHGKGLAIKWGEDVKAVIDSLGVCLYTAETIHLMAAAFSAATGVAFSPEELLQIGERVYNIQKAFNARQGMTRKDDDYVGTDRFTREPVKGGPCDGQVLVERDVMLDEYYRAREWDPETGLQTRQALERLGLGQIADALVDYGAIR